MTTPESLDFYRQHAQEYADVVHDFLDQQYRDPSHPLCAGDYDLLGRLKELASGKKGLDAGCGAAARDVYLLWRDGYDTYGIDAVPENIEVASETHPEIAERICVGDLTEPLPFSNESFDFVLCNAVIQHIAREVVKDVTLKELVRVLKPGGILQLMFKNGEGDETILDPDYDVERIFHLYDEVEIASIVDSYGCKMIEPESEGALGGFMYLTDMKPMRHCVFHARKR